MIQRSTRGALLALATVAGGQAFGGNLDISLAVTDDPDASSSQLLATVFEARVAATLEQSSTPVHWQRLTVTGEDESSAVFDLVTSGEAQVALVSVTRHPWSLYPLNVGYATPFSCDDPAIVGPAGRHHERCVRNPRSGLGELEVGLPGRRLCRGTLSACHDIAGRADRGLGRQKPFDARAGD